MEMEMAKKATAATPAATPQVKPVVAPGVSGEDRKTVFPKGTIVQYQGSRTQFAGQTGEVTGYRGPTTGLWVKFPTGLGSISTRGAQVVTKGKKAKPASSSATRKAPKKVQQAAPAQAEPEGQAGEQSA